MPKTRRAARRRWGVSPLGGAIAELAAHPDRVWDVGREWFGKSEMGRRVARCLRRARVDDRGASLAGDRGTARVQAAMLRTLLLVLNETHPVTGVAASPRLWQGEADREHAQRIAGRRGLAARAGVSTRQLQRYLRAFSRAGVLGRRQVSTEAPERLRGRRWGFCQYRWLCELPRAIRERLTAWTAKRPPPGPPTRAGGPPEPLAGLLGAPG